MLARTLAVGPCRRGYALCQLQQPLHAHTSASKAIAAATKATPCKGLVELDGNGHCGTRAPKDLIGGGMHQSSTGGRRRIEAGAGLECAERCGIATQREHNVEGASALSTLTRFH